MTVLLSSNSVVIFDDPIFDTILFNIQAKATYVGNHEIVSEVRPAGFVGAQGCPGMLRRLDSQFHGAQDFGAGHP